MAEPTPIHFLLSSLDEANPVASIFVAPHFMGASSEWFYCHLEEHGDDNDQWQATPDNWQVDNWIKLMARPTNDRRQPSEWRS